MKARSMSRALVLGNAFGIALVLLIAGVALDRGLSHALLRDLDDSLEHELALFLSTIKLTPDGIETDFEELAMPQFEEEDGPGFLELRQLAGEFVYESPSWIEAQISWPNSDHLSLPVETRPSPRESADGSGTDEPGPDEQAPYEVSPGGDRTRPAQLIGAASTEFGRTAAGDRVRGRTQGFRPIVEIDSERGPDEEPPSGNVTLVLTVARSTESIDALQNRLRLLLLVVGAASGVLAVFLLGAVVRRSLRPLDALATEIRSLSDGDLSRRVPMSETPIEVEPVIARLNELLAALERSFTRERQFSQDIAHELRTPLAGLRTSFEVTLSRERAVAQYREELDEALEIVIGLQEIVQTLLDLARLESGEAVLEKTNVDLEELVRSTWHGVTRAAEERSVDLTIEAEPGLVASTDQTLLRTALRNLLDNAAEHADPGGHASVQLRREQDAASLVIRNSGSRVPQHEADALFARFARHDTARSSTGRHYGLGLALVQEIARTLGLRVAIRSEVGGEFEVTLRIPLVTGSGPFSNGST
ncbi:MAG: HAMP domain-containing protein [Candidatus Eisenbacteria bacterium]|uniref:histidine kinase n=1 Tax=Eiseniibacteriota bacterium TaxID=2212470 RepID=A0A956NFP7_UNCEI|nr:HAMP domain-containing protein [Candidatus Eisenbacteria bacterium]